MQVIFGLKAISDLEQIGEGFLRNEPKAAAERVLALRRTCEDLVNFPQIGRIVPGYGLRKVVFGQFLIFYRISGNRLEIARIFHGAQDWRAALRRLI